jgi:hypothetical protein
LDDLDAHGPKVWLLRWTDYGGLERFGLLAITRAVAMARARGRLIPLRRRTGQLNHDGSPVRRNSPTVTAIARILALALAFDKSVSYEPPTATPDRKATSSV